jgi:hypothetical protein
LNLRRCCQKCCFFRGWASWFTSVIPDTQEVEIGRIVVQGQLRKKLVTLTQERNQAWWFALAIPAMWVAIDRGITV